MKRFIPQMLRGRIRWVALVGAAGLLASLGFFAALALLGEWRLKTAQG